MSDPIQAIAVILGACSAAAMIGASFTLGVAFICRKLEWAPVNTKVIINNNHAICDECGGVVGQPKERT